RVRTRFCDMGVVPSMGKSGGNIDDTRERKLARDSGEGTAEKRRATLPGPKQGSRSALWSSPCRDHGSYPFAIPSLSSALHATDLCTAIAEDCQAAVNHFLLG